MLMKVNISFALFIIKARSLYSGSVYNMTIGFLADVYFKLSPIFYFLFFLL